MNIKKQIPRLASFLLSFAMAFGNVIPVYASEAIISESSLEEMGLNESLINEDEPEAQSDSESRYETVEVGYSQSSSYFVTIPKTIVLGTDKKSPYSIKVEGDIVANKQVCVVPVDGIENTEVFDFYMSDQITGSTKSDVVAEVSQSKFYWNHEEAAAGYEETDNYIVADGLSAGKWKGNFQLEISMRTDPSHIHNYVGEITKEPTCTEAGEKTYICDCGDSYTEIIDPTGHHFEKGECTICGEKDPDHEHSYTEVITKQPTCTEAGEKTYTCDCGDSYTETIPATGHHYVDGECEHCGEKDPDAHTHNYIEAITKEPTCTEAGEKTYTCDCGDSYTEVIPATGHHYGDDDKCTDCGELNPEHKHNYTEEVTKQPACTEDGEKTYTCICGDSYTEAIPATGHNFVDNTTGNFSNHKCTVCGHEEEHRYDDALKCTVCGHLKGEYTLIFDSESKIGNLSDDTEYELEKGHISDGDKIILPNASSSCYELDGWYYAKEVSQPYMYNMGLSHAWYGTYDKSYNCWANPDVRLYAYGNGVDVLQPSAGTEWTTNYNWQNTATTDVFTINVPAVYEFQITEKQHLYPITLNQNGSYSLQYLLKDITNDKNYELRGLVSFYNDTVTLYDYGNIMIKCSKVDNVKKNDTTKWYDGTITYYYTVYFEPGEYQITLSGRIGDSDGEPNKSSIVVDMYGQNSSFYELYPLNDGETFDASKMYTVEGDKTIYLVPNWKYKVHYDNEKITEATCTSNGTRYRSCFICKYSSTETIPMLGHNYQEEVITAVTCTTSGESTYTCVNCNDTYTETKPALGHDLDENSICKRCGKKATSGLYNEEGNRIATWEELVNDYGMDITTNYTGSTFKTSETSPYYIFTNNEELSSGTKLVIDDTIDKIGDFAFNSCSSLTEIEVSDSITGIGNYAFYGCSSLTKIEIPDSVTKIGKYAFYGCSSLIEIEIPDSVTSLGDYVFDSCTSLVNINLGEGITIIPANAFNGCSSLTEMELPDSVVRIMNGAFSRCTNLKSLYIPASVTAISYTNATWNKPIYSSFYACSSLTIYCGAASRPAGWMSYWNALSYTASISGSTTTYTNVKYVPAKWNITRDVYRESYK